MRLLSGPEGSIRVVQLQPNQLSLKLWEPLCADNPNPGGPPLLLMPPEYEWLDPENGPRELAEIMYIGQRVSSCTRVQEVTLLSPSMGLAVSAGNCRGGCWIASQRPLCARNSLATPDRSRSEGQEQERGSNILSWSRNLQQRAQLY